MPRSKAKAKSRSNGGGNGNGNGRSRRRNGNGRASNVLQSIQPLMRTTANYRPMNNRVHQMSGSDFLSTVSVAPNITDPDDRILSVLSVSPSLFPGTRLAVMSQLFERYRFVSFRVRYVPAVPTTLGCQLLAYLDTDPLDDPSAILDGDQLLRQATAHTGSQQWNFNTSKVISLPMRSDGQLYYTGLVRQNERFNVQAKIYLLQVTRPVDINGSPVASSIECGSLYIDWSVRFETPQINPFAVTSPFAQNIILTIGSSFPPGTIRTLNGFAPNSSYGCLPSMVLENNGSASASFYRMRPALISDGVDFDYGTDPSVQIHVSRTDVVAPNPNQTKPACFVGDFSGQGSAEYDITNSTILPLKSDNLGRVRFFVVNSSFANDETNTVKLYFIQGLASPISSSLSLSPVVLVSSAAAANSVTAAVEDLRQLIDQDVEDDLEETEIVDN